MLKKVYLLGGETVVPNTVLAKVQTLGDATAYEQQVVNLVNAARAAAGVPALTNIRILQGVCDVRVDEITMLFDHKRPYKDSSGVPLSCNTVLSDDLLGDSLVPTSTYFGENIAWGQATPAAVMNDWLSSPGHRENILRPSFRYIGVGYIVGPDGRPYWVQFFLS